MKKIPDITVAQKMINLQQSATSRNLEFDLQYLIIDDGHFFMDMIWSEESKFENANFTREEKETIKVKFSLNPKNRVEIEDDEDWTTVKGHFDERFIVTEPEYVRESGKYLNEKIEA